MSASVYIHFCLQKGRVPKLGAQPTRTCWGWSSNKCRVLIREKQNTVRMAEFWLAIVRKKKKKRDLCVFQLPTKRHSLTTKNLPFLDNGSPMHKLLFCRPPVTQPACSTDAKFLSKLDVILEHLVALYDRKCRLLSVISLQKRLMQEFWPCTFFFFCAISFRVSRNKWKHRWDKKKSFYYCVNRL